MIILSVEIKTMRIAAFIIVFLLSMDVPAQEFHLVFLNKKEDKAVLPEEEVKKLMDGHMANIERLAKEGKLWAAGPFEGGGGIFIFKTKSLDEVRGWISTDPAVAANRWNVEIFPYLPRSGSVCTVGEGYTMTNYFFVRYAVTSTKSDATQLHLDHLKGSTKVIAEGGLGSNQGSILVLSEEPTIEWMNADPAVKNGSLLPSMKKLYIAKGSFCEGN